MVTRAVTVWLAFLYLKLFISIFRKFHKLQTQFLYLPMCVMSLAPVFNLCLDANKKRVEIVGGKFSTFQHLLQLYIDRYDKCAITINTFPVNHSAARTYSTEQYVNKLYTYTNHLFKTPKYLLVSIFCQYTLQLIVFINAISFWLG